MYPIHYHQAMVRQQNAISEADGDFESFGLYLLQERIFLLITHGYHNEAAIIQARSEFKWLIKKQGK